jgi:hypothetical protein
MVEWPAKNRHVFVLMKNGVLLIPALFVALLKYPLTSTDPLLMSLWNKVKGNVECFAGFFWLICVPMIVSIALDWWLSYSEKQSKGDSNKSSMYKVLLASFNEIVGEKANRFAEYVPQKNDDIFNQITQPDTQKTIIIKNLHSFLKIILGEDFKIVVAEFRGGKMIKIKAFAPSSVSPSLSIDQFENSFFSYVAKQKRTSVIPDINKEMKKGARSNYKPSETGVESGSIIGYPVFLKGSRLRYVITIKSDAKIINNKFKEAYKDVVEMFLVRIRLECFLSDIKEKRAEISTSMEV